MGFRISPAGREVNVTVTVDRNGGGEIWTRNFGGRKSLFAAHV